MTRRWFQADAGCRTNDPTAPFRSAARLAKTVCAAGTGRRPNTDHETKTPYRCHYPPRTNRTRLLLLRLLLLSLPLLKLTFHALSELLALGEPDQTFELIADEVQDFKHILAVAQATINHACAIHTGPIGAQ